MRTLHMRTLPPLILTPHPTPHPTPQAAGQVEGVGGLVRQAAWLLGVCPFLVRDRGALSPPPLSQPLPHAHPHTPVPTHSRTAAPPHPRIPAPQRRRTPAPPHLRTPSRTSAPPHPHFAQFVYIFANIFGQFVNISAHFVNIFGSECAPTPRAPPPPCSPSRSRTHALASRPRPRQHHPWSAPSPSAAPSMPRAAGLFSYVVNRGRVGGEDPVTTPAATVESCCPEPRPGMRPLSAVGALDITHVVRCLRAAARLILYMGRSGSRLAS